MYIVRHFTYILLTYILLCTFKRVGMVCASKIEDSTVRLLLLPLRILLYSADTYTQDRLVLNRYSRFLYCLFYNYYTAIYCFISLSIVKINGTKILTNE